MNLTSWMSLDSLKTILSLWTFRKESLSWRLEKKSCNFFNHQRRTVCIFACDCAGVEVYWAHLKQTTLFSIFNILLPFAWQGGETQQLFKASWRNASPGDCMRGVQELVAEEITQGKQKNEGRSSLRLSSLQALPAPLLIKIHYTSGRRLIWSHTCLLCSWGFQIVIKWHHLHQCPDSAWLSLHKHLYQMGEGQGWISAQSRALLNTSCGCKNNLIISDGVGFG